MKFTISDLLEVTVGIGILSALARLGFNGFVVSFLIVNLLLLVVPAGIFFAIFTSVTHREASHDVRTIPYYGLLKKALLVTIVCEPIVWSVLFLKVWAS